MVTKRIATRQVADFDEFNDSEECYRRGYAQAVWDCAEALGDERLRAYYQAVYAWRLRGYGKGRPQLGDGALELNPPPREVLRKLFGV